VTMANPMSLNAWSKALAVTEYSPELVADVRISDISTIGSETAIGSP
jgi:hypothetical protein